MPDRLAVRVTKDAERQIRGGHPWVFDGSIQSVKPKGEPGDLAVVFDDKRRFLAIGLYDPASPIRIKVLHRGDPTPIDASFWAARIDAALAARPELVGAATTDGYRVVHGENDGLPGLVVDRYAEVLVVKLYSEAWFPHLNDVIAVLVERLAPAAIVLRLARVVEPDADAGWIDGHTIYGALPNGSSIVTFRENSLTFEADVVHGQKTGFFLDQRDNRALIRSRSVGRRVLDVYSCSGGFTVNAAAGGAVSVHSIDISAGAIAASRRNMALNADRPNVAACTHEATVGDATTVLRGLLRAKARFDMVIIDPPSMASTKAQIDGALATYARLADLGIELLDGGGVLFQASCSSRVNATDFYDTVAGMADRVGRPLARETYTAHAVDHPVSFPEGAYLKAVIATATGAPRR